MESTGSYWVPVFNILEDRLIIVLAQPGGSKEPQRPQDGPQGCRTSGRSAKT
jgi:hypothetical protein